MSNNEFSRGLTEKRHLYTPIHRRTHSTNIETVKGIASVQSHRRTLSNTAQEFTPIQNPQPIKNSFRPLLNIEPAREPLTPDSLNSPASSASSQHIKSNKKGFTGLLDAAISYFSHEPQLVIQPPSNEINEMKKEIRRLTEKQLETEKTNEKLLNDCSIMKMALEEQKAKKENYEKHIQSLQGYTQELENAIKKLQAELKNEQKRNEQLRMTIVTNESQGNERKLIGREIYEDDTKKRGKEESLRVDKPSPTPIMYKPISQRGMKEEKRRSMGFT
ncbi:unnamed protein product [Blepharisma stoltei]|uniref:Uncharacterized protein n=1 Tax=Blepharisma stoltei TaxID=1481888 RepID=A0AAU9ISA8_9CILI|nr:unnamed protein product [Blepharisma stoltei]